MCGTAARGDAAFCGQCGVRLPAAPASPLGAGTPAASPSRRCGRLLGILAFAAAMLFAAQLLRGGFARGGRHRQFRESHSHEILDRIPNRLDWVQPRSRGFRTQDQESRRLPRGRDSAVYSGRDEFENPGTQTIIIEREYDISDPDDFSNHDCDDH